jgi:hypothetical protein
MEKKEILFFALFVVFWIFSLLSKKFARKQNSIEKKGLILRALEFIAELKEAGENEATPFESHPEVLKVQTDDVIIPTVKNTASEFRENSVTSGIINEHCHHELRGRSRSSSRAARKIGTGKRFPKQKMRDAIVWSEILGTPVGLRDN